MVSPATVLTDLRTRVGSNTLTSLQQELLQAALASMISNPFPSTDQTGQPTPMAADFTVSRLWLNPIYALIEAVASGGTNVNPTTQTVWWIDPINGSDTNSGATQGTALKSAAALATLWKGSAGGGRPILAPSTGTTITINITSNLLATDPLAPLLDVDLAAGTTLQFFGAAQTPALATTIATANTWARTSANGQVKLTAAGVDWSVHGAQLLQAVGVSPAPVAWFYSGTTTGVFTVGYSQQTPGSFTTPTQTNFAAAQQVQLVPLVVASLGTGFTTRAFPEGTSPQGALVVFNRMSLTNVDANDPVVLNNPTVEYILQETELRLSTVQVIAGLLSGSNSFCLDSSVTALGSGEIVWLFGGGVEGQTSGGLFATQGGRVIVDFDAMVHSGAAVEASEAGNVFWGNAGFWTNAGDAALNAQSGGVVEVGLTTTAANATAYGTDGGHVVDCQGGGTLFYGQSTSAACFNFTDSAFKMGGATSGYGFNTGSGAITGPTTYTFAHVDTALGAGTGFGGTAISFNTGDRFLAAITS